MDSIEQLMSFSLTRQEAAIYLTLLSEGPLTGYEVSKQSGISRSNSYTALASLVEKGAAQVMEDTATRYVPVDIEEFCENKIRAMTKQKQSLHENLPLAKADCDGYITIRGGSHVLDKTVHLIVSAQERLYLSVGGLYLPLLEEYLRSSVASGRKVVVMTDVPFKLEGAILYMAKNPVEQFRLITDSSAVLTGDLSPQGSCLYSKNRNLVDLFKQTLRNEMRLIELQEI